MSDEQTINGTSETNLQKWRFQAYRLMVPIIIALCITAFIANAAVLLASRWVAANRFHATLKLTLSLAVSDIWTSFFIAISLVFNSYLPVIHKIMSDACTALTLEIIRSGGLLTGVLHLLALSFNHYLSIAYPFRYSSILNSRNTLVIILAMWCLPPTGYLLYSSVLPEVGYQTPNGTCLNLTKWNTFAFRLTNSLLIIFPLIIMLALYVNIMFTLRRLRLHLSEGTRGSSRQNLARERRMLTTTMLICGMFFMGWFCACAQFLLTCADCPLSFQFVLKQSSSERAFKIIITFSFLQLFCIMVKSIANPVLYAVRIPEIKEQFHRAANFVRQILGKPTVPPHGRTGPTTFSQNEATKCATKSTFTQNPAATPLLVCSPNSETTPIINGKEKNIDDTLL